MAGFFDKLNANLTNAGRTVSQKVKNSSDASKLMNEINTENKSIQANLNAIGQLYYDLCKDAPDEQFRAMVEAITYSKQRIEELQESVKLIRARTPELVPVPEGTAQPVMPSTMVCMGCGNTYQEGTGFCAVCGRKLVAQYQSTAAAAAAPGQTAEDVQVNPEAEIIEEAVIIDAEPEYTQFCPHCGNKIDTGSQKFCGKCGKAI